MSDPNYRASTLRSFIVPTPAATQIVNTSIIPNNVTDAMKQMLVDYHPKPGTDYKVICDVRADTEVQGDKAEDPDSFLRIFPQGAVWNDKQKSLLDQLKFVPVPGTPVPGRKPVLMMKRSGFGNIRLANTSWYLVNARLEKSVINDKVLNDVTLTWEFRAGVGEDAYLNPVVTCWKWESPERKS